MSVITIPVDVRLLTLYTTTYQIVTINVSEGSRSHQRRIRQAEEHDFPPGMTERDIRSGIERANVIWRPAEIAFTVRNCTSARLSTTAENARVDRREFLSLASRFPARNGISMLVVKDFRSATLAGRAAEAMSVCMLERNPNPAFGNHTAHEFGHLLGLEHPEEDPDSVEDSYNLMYEGLAAAQNLTPDQVNTARTSRLARRHIRRPVPSP